MVGRGLCECFVCFVRVFRFLVFEVWDDGEAFFGNLEVVIYREIREREFIFLSYLYNVVWRERSERGG